MGPPRSCLSAAQCRRLQRFGTLSTTSTSNGGSCARIAARHRRRAACSSRAVIGNALADTPTPYRVESSSLDGRHDEAHGGCRSPPRRGCVLGCPGVCRPIGGPASVHLGVDQLLVLGDSIGGGSKPVAPGGSDVGGVGGLRCGGRDASGWLEATRHPTSDAIPGRVDVSPGSGSGHDMPLSLGDVPHVRLHVSGRGGSQRPCA